MTLDPRTDPNALARHADWVRRLARRLLEDAHLADDVAQDALTAALVREGGFDGPGGLRRWLSRATRRLAWRAGSREREQHRREARAARPEAAEDPVDRLFLQRRLTEALLGLDEPYREALVLHLLDDLPPRHVARRLGITPAAARQRISRGLARLRARLADEVEDGRFAPALVALAAGRGVTGTTAMEAMLMGAKTKTVVAVAAVAAVVGVVSWGSGPSRPGPVRPAETGGAEQALAGAETEAPPPDGDERRSATTDAATAVRAVRVVDEGGGPVSGATVIACSEGRVVGTARTDGDGRAAVGLETDLVVGAAPGRPAVPLEVEGDESTLVLTLARGERLAGHLRVGGAPPVEPVTLSLRHDRPLESRVPPAAAEALEDAGLGDATTAPVGADGRFGVGGLRPGWSGALELPRGLRLVADPAPGARNERRTTAVLPRAAPDLVLEAVRVPTVRGRFVRSGDGSPVPDVQYSFHHSSGGSSKVSRGESDANGRFEHELLFSSDAMEWMDAHERPAVKYIAFYGIAPTYRWEAEEIPTDGNLGDLPLDRPPRRTLHVRVETANGEPAPDAFIRVLWERELHATDGSGYTRIAGFPGGAATIRVSARGWSTQEVEVPATDTDSEDPFVVVLEERTNRLDVTVVDAEGRPASGAFVDLGGEEPLYSGPANLEASMSWFTSHRTGGRRVYRHWLDRNGRLVLQSLVPELPLELGVVDALDDRRTGGVHTFSLQAPAPGEESVLTLTLLIPLAQVRGRVLDRGGAPIARASVTVSEDGDWGPSASTGPDGTFLVDGIVCSPRRAMVDVTHPGHVPLRTEFVLAGTVDLGDLVLGPAVPLELHVLDPSGDPIDVAGVEARFPGGPTRSGERLQPGRFDFLDLPPGPVTFRIRHGPHDHERTFDPQRPHGSWTLPAHGALVLEMTREIVLERDHHPHARLRSPDHPEALGTLRVSEVPGRRTDPYPLRPGTWRVELLARDRLGEGAVETDLGRAWEVEVRAGETTVLALE